MAVAFVRAANSAADLTGTSDSFAVDCTGGSLLLVWLPGVWVTAPSGISFTYNGVSLTSVVAPFHGANSSYVSLFYMLNPPSGSHTLAGSWTNSALHAKVCAQVYSGALSPTGGQSGSAVTSVAVTAGANDIAAVGWANQSGTADTVVGGTTDMNGAPSGGSAYGAGHKSGALSSIGTNGGGTNEDAIYGINIPAAGAITNQAINVSSSTTTAMVRSAGKVVSVSCVTASAFKRAVSKIVSIASSSTSAFTKRANKSVLVASATSSTLLKRAGKAVSVASLTATSIVELIGRVLVISVGCASSVSVVKRAGKIVSVSCHSASTFVKSAQKIVAVTCSGTVGILRSYIARVRIVKIRAFITSYFAKATIKSGD